MKWNGTQEISFDVTCVRPQVVCFQGRPMSRSVAGAKPFDVDLQGGQHLLHQLLGGDARQVLLLTFSAARRALTWPRTPGFGVLA